MTGPMVAWLSGLTLGLVSSAHCLAMCGPLVLVAGRRSAASSRRARAGHALLYHSGRVLMYLALALPAGLFGRTMVGNDLGRALAIGVGIVLLIAAVGLSRVPLMAGLSPRFTNLMARVSWAVLHWTGARPVVGPLVAGAFNGLLPCGLVYAAASAAAATGSLSGAAALMAGFGIGTSVALVAVSIGAPSISMPWRIRLGRVSPVLLVLTAVLLIARGIAAPHRHTGVPPALAPHIHASR